MSQSRTGVQSLIRGVQVGQDKFGWGSPFQVCQKLGEYVRQDDLLEVYIGLEAHVVQRDYAGVRRGYPVRAVADQGAHES